MNIFQVNNLINENNFDQVETILEGFLQVDPNNTEVLLKLARIELIPPLSDHLKSIEYLKKIFEYDHNNFEANLLLCCIYHFYLGDIDEILLKKLDELKK